MIKRSYKYRLFTNANQERELSIMLETHRRLYNEALDGRMLCWDAAGVNWTFFEQLRWFTIKRKLNAHYARINSWSGQNTLRALDRAYSNFFKSGGFPRFKSRDRFNSFAFDMSANGGGCKIVSGKLRVQNVGAIRVKWHRELPEAAKVKQARIIREGGNWFVVFSIELDGVDRCCGNSSVGVDVGITAFATTSNGQTLGDSKVFLRAQKKLRVKQRSLSRCKKGSARRIVAKHAVSKLYMKVRNTRKDTHRKVAKTLVDQCSVIAVERLNIKGMLKNRRLARSISDAGWGQFIEILSSKAESAGAQVIKVDPKNTSQLCSGCGEVVKKSLSVRVHKCKCGLVLDRDVNAARNILARAVPEGAKLGVT